MIITIFEIDPSYYYLSMVYRRLPPDPASVPFTPDINLPGDEKLVFYMHGFAVDFESLCGSQAVASTY